MNDENKKPLGIKFYRNFVGIEKPLKISYRFGSKGDLWCIKENTIHFRESNGNELAFNVKCGDAEYMGKPCLRTIEDLSDEELSSIVCAGFHDDLFMSGVIVNRFNNGSIEVTHSTLCMKINIEYDMHGNLCFWDDNNEALDTEAMHAQLNEYHSHKKAKEYISNGLALSIKDLK